MTDEDAAERELRKPAAVVFVPGIFGGEQTWSRLLPWLRTDSYVERFFYLTTFTYDSPKILFNPLKRIPDFGDVARELATTLQQDSRLNGRSCIVLVGHSQGGLIIQRMLVDAVRDGHANEQLARIRGVVLLATPNGGSELLLSARRFLSPFWGHPQERTLRPFNEEIANMHAVLLERVVYAQRASSNSRPIRFDVYTGNADGVVPGHSARGLFPHTGTLPGDHFSIVRPNESCDPNKPKPLVALALIDAFHRGFNALEPDTTVFRTDILDPRNKDDVRDAEELLDENFLDSQNVTKEDFRHWLPIYEQTFGLPMRVIVARVDERIRGVLMFHESPPDGLIVIDYVACRQESAIDGLLFRKLIAQLRGRAKSTGIPSVVFEIEDPSKCTGADANRARARLRKFEAFGARTIGGLSYLAPDMQDFGVAQEEGYLLMHVSSGLQPATLRRRRVQQIVRFLYTTWYGNWFSRRFKGREEELRAYVEGLYERVAGDAAKLPDTFPLEDRRTSEATGR
jgi:pimeloyl-ACP methyl ester carboxylesterase